MVRICDLARQLMPTCGQAFSARIARADLAILGVWGDPRTLAVQPIAALTEFVTTISTGCMVGPRPRRGFRPRPRRSGCTATLTPYPSPVVGRPGCFPDADRFVSFTRPVPGASETGANDRKGQPITMAGNRKLRRMLYQAADTARKHRESQQLFVLVAEWRSLTPPLAVS